jgi:ATP:ADP antiporter, AAA family
VRQVERPVAVADCRRTFAETPPRSKPAFSQRKSRLFWKIRPSWTPRRLRPSSYAKGHAKSPWLMGSAVLLATFSGVIMIAQLIVGKAARDTVFLSSYPTTALPAAMVATAAATVPVVLGGSRLITRFGPQRFMPVFLLGNAVAFVFEWMMLPVAPQTIAATLYLHVGLFGGLSMSGFWSVVNERFDPHAAKKAVARIGSGLAFGGLFGGLLAGQIAAWFGVRSMLLTLASMNLLIAFAMMGLGHASSSPVVQGDGSSGLKVLAGSSYLRNLAYFVAIAAVSSSVLDYSFKSSVAAAIAHPQRLASFFAVYYMATSTVNVVLQSTAARYSLQKLGIGVTLAVLPVVLLLGGTLSAVIGGLWAIVALTGAESVLSSSFFRLAYEPLYIPLPREQKRSTKAIIDVAADKLGSALGSGGIWLVVAAAPKHAWPTALAITMLAAGVSLWLCARLQRGYVTQLASSLRTGMVQLPEIEVTDATTRLTMSQTFGGIDRSRLLREIDAASKQHVADPELVRSVTELSSGDSRRIRTELELRLLDHRLVPLAIPLLEPLDTRTAAIHALEGVAEYSVGQLSDALLNESLSENVRCRIPAILAHVANPRAVRALTYGLSDSDFELRERCARALLTLRRKDTQLRPPESVVISAIRRELAVSQHVWGSRGNAPNAAEPALSQLSELSTNRSLQHVFTILCLSLEPDEVELALRALGTNDPKLRGTALEYLENVVPGELKPALWPHLAAGPTRRGSRSRHELAGELKRTFSG